MSSQVFVVGVGMTRFGRHPDKSVKNSRVRRLSRHWLTGAAAKTDVQAAFFGNSTRGTWKART